MSTSLDSSSSGRCLAPIDVFVLAGGLGTRIRPLLGDVPKLLAPIAGRPFLHHLLDWLRRFGARRIVLALGHRADAVVDYLRAHPQPDLVLSHVIEQQPLGTAGAIRFARDELHTDPVLVMNGDSFVQADLCGLLTHHRASGATVTILCATVEDVGRFGRVVVDRAGFVQGFVEKDADCPGPALVNAGVYLLSAALLDRIAAGQAVSLEHDVFARLPAGSLASFAECARFVDIGTPESLARAGEMLAPTMADSSS